MPKRAVRFLVFLLAVAAVAGGGYELLRAERAATTARVSDAQFDDTYARALRAAFDLRTSQQALLVPQQGIDWWEQRGNAAAADLEASLHLLKQLAVQPESLNDLDAATSALEALRTTQVRVLNAVRDRDRAGAATIVFGEGLDQANTILDRLASARESEALARADRHTLTVQRNAAVAGAAAGVALLACLILLPRPRATAGEITPSDARPGGSLLDLSIRPAPPGESENAAGQAAEPAAHAARADAPDVLAAPATAPLVPAQPVEASMPPRTSAEAGVPVRDRRKAPELRAAADLCTDFARLLEPQELPGLLERAAKLLDAQGLIVWIADDARRELRPSLSHGYPLQAIARLPAIGRDDDNATAAAFRVGELQVVKTNGMEPGAVAVPLITASGCVGVMAAEVRHGREASESARAIARIVAAQLATLVEVPTAGTDAPPARQEATG